MYLRQSTTQTIRFGPCLDQTDGFSEQTGLTLAQADMRLSKDGNGFAQKNASGNATHDSDGWYSTSFNNTDTGTVGELILNVHQPANMLPVWMRWWVLEEAVYDSMFGAGAAGPLQPTTAGRTLDIAATGEVALDFGSTIGTLDAAQFGADFITSAKIADNAFLAVNFAAGSLDGKGDWNIGKSGYALTVADWNVGKTGYSLTLADWNVGKTGYSLTQAFPTNFADLGITVTTGRVDINVNNDKTGYSVSALAANVITAASINNAAFIAAKFGGDFITSASIADNAFLAVNFAAASLNGKGDWNIGKTGYALTVTPPTAAQVVDEWESQSQADPTGFHVNLQEWLGVAPGGLSGGAVGVNVLQWIGVAPSALISGRVDSSTGALAANVITAASINAAAFTAAKFGADFITSGSIADNAFLAVNFAAASLNGKGDWNVGKTGYSLTLADWNVGKTGYSLTTQDWATPADVNTQMLDVLTTDTFAEPGQGAPLPTTSIERKLAYLYKFLINEKESNSTTISVKNAAATVVDHKSAISDDGTTYTQGEYVTGP